MPLEIRLPVPSASFGSSIPPNVSCVPTAWELVSVGSLPLTWPRVAMGPEALSPAATPSEGYRQAPPSNMAEGGHGPGSLFSTIPTHQM